MIYLHRDSIYENQTIGSWAIPIFKYLRKKGKQVKLIENNTLDNRVQTTATWVFRFPSWDADGLPIVPEPEKPKTKDTEKKTKPKK